MDGDSVDGGESGRGRRRRRIRRPHGEYGAGSEEDVPPEKSSASEGDSDAINELIDFGGLIHMSEAHRTLYFDIDGTLMVARGAGRSAYSSF